MAKHQSVWHVVTSAGVALLVGCATPASVPQGEAPAPANETPGPTAEAPARSVTPSGVAAPAALTPGRPPQSVGPDSPAASAGAAVPARTARSGPAVPTGAAVAASGRQTLQEALAQTYQSNPTLAAQRSALRAANEQIAQALAGYRPTIQASGDIGVEYLDTTPDSSGRNPLYPGSIGIQVQQPIYSGGRTQADIRRADNVIQATRATASATEQQVLLDAATAYMNVMRDQAVRDLQVNNEQVLQRQLQASRDRFAVGEVTRTDVSQSESRLAGATAQRIQAEGALRSSIADYVRAVGEVPTTLIEPGPLTIVPGSLDEAVSLAEANNPNVVAAAFTERAAAEGIDVAYSDLMPQLSLTGTMARARDSSQVVHDVTTGEIRLQLTVPLYLAGAAESRVRQARYTANQRRIEVADTRRRAVQTAVSSWEALVASRAAIQSLLAQVAAARVALDGVQQEAQVGARTVLDVLNAEQELLNAEVSLVRSRRDEVVAAFQVLAAIGRLSARDLGLPVEYYDPEIDYRNTRSRWWGTSIAPYEAAR